jgi:hypothetical protein
MRLVLLLTLAVLIAVGGLTGCSGASHEPGHELAMAPLGEMPVEVQRAPVMAQQAYQFAAANPDVLKQLPCYCGCGAMGHTSNYACYVANVDANGALTFDPHALACSICVDITQDAMRMMRQGEGIQTIRAFVDNTYSRYGPSNMP